MIIINLIYFQVLLLTSLLPSCHTLFLALGSPETFGTICGFYSQTVLLPVVETVYRTVCSERQSDNCQNTAKNTEHQGCEETIARVCHQVKRRGAWAPVCGKDAKEYCGCQVCRQVPVKVERLVPTKVQKRTCGVGGPGGPVHDGRGAHRKDYHVAVRY